MFDYKRISKPFVYSIISFYIFIDMEWITGPDGNEVDIGEMKLND